MDWSLFHFLRPWWLLLILPALALLFFRPKLGAMRSPWHKVIDPHLLPHVIDRDQKPHKNGLQRWLLPSFLIFVTLALAGPTAKKLPEQSRFSKSPLVILLELSPHMLAKDFSPSRLKLAQLKLHELVKHRDLGDATLIAFAGDAHVVVPATKDYNTLLSLNDSLSPSIMPIPGSNLIHALKLALDTSLDGAQKMLIINSSHVDTKPSEVISFAKQNRLELLFWTFATTQGAPIAQADGSFASDRGGNVAISTRQDGFLRELAQDPDISVINASLDNSDVAAVRARLNSPLSGKLTESLPYDQWYDLGPYFLAIACVLFLMGFFMAKEQWWLLGILFAFSSPPSDAASFIDWFKRDEQKAYEALQNNETAKAAELYPDDFGKGTAYFKAGQYDKAIEHLKREDKPEALYNLGNAYAHKSLIKEAIAAYESALKKDPNHADAKHNKEILEKLLQEQEKKQQPNPDQQQQNEQKPEEQKQEEKQENSGKGEQKDEKKSDSSATNEEQKSETEPKKDQNQPAKEQKSGEKKEQEAKQAAESKKEPKLDANTLYYFDKLENNNNLYLKRKFMHETRKNKGVKQ